MNYEVHATDKAGRVSKSLHSTLEEAKKSAACCRGRYPWGNRVKVVPVRSPTKP
jgi:hypothetical protein